MGNGNGQQACMRRQTQFVRRYLRGRIKVSSIGFFTVVVLSFSKEDVSTQGYLLDKNHHKKVSRPIEEEVDEADNIFQRSELKNLTLRTYLLAIDRSNDDSSRFSSAPRRETRSSFSRICLTFEHASSPGDDDA